jgi:hypothetical protein
MTDWLLSVLWYTSFLSMAVGGVALLRPIRRLWLGVRWRAAALAIAAAGATVANARCAPPPTDVVRPATKLDAFAPTYHFREVHTRTVHASPARVVAAIKSVSADEIALFTFFTTIRRLGRAGPESILNAPAGKPILDVATESGFLLLADDGREVVLGAVVAAPPGFRLAGEPDSRWFAGLATPGIVKATMNFLVEGERAARTRLTTETRVFGTDSAAARRFTPYWRTIFPGSWIMRVTWLQAIARRAES